MISYFFFYFFLNIEFDCWTFNLFPQNQWTLYFIKIWSYGHHFHPMHTPTWHDKMTKAVFLVAPVCVLDGNSDDEVTKSKFCD